MPKKSYKQKCFYLLLKDGMEMNDKKLNIMGVNWKLFDFLKGVWGCVWFSQKKKKGVTMEGRLLKKEVLNSFHIWKGACRNWGDGFFEFLNCEGGGG